MKNNHEEPENGLDNILDLVEAYSNHEPDRYPPRIVEKLKAWKRLKDKGFRFAGYGHYDDSGDEAPYIAFEYPDLDEMFYNKQVVADLDLLFGGEE